MLLVVCTEEIDPQCRVQGARDQGFEDEDEKIVPGARSQGSGI